MNIALRASTGSLSIDKLIAQIANILMMGGVGPGSYYPLVYLQIAIILTLLYPLFMRYTMKQLLLPFIIVCLGMDMTLTVIQCPEWIYRLTAIRYIFLIYLGMAWVKNGIKINPTTITLSLLTVFLTMFFKLTTLDLQPFFFATGWKTHRWICYYYVAFLLPAVVWGAFRMFYRIKHIENFISDIAKSSYEIFLIQMVIFFYLSMIGEHLIINIYVRYVIMIPIEVFLSLWIGISYRRLKDKRCKIVPQSDK